jgi:hypothetical protein
MKNELDWKKAKKLCHLSEEDIRMARELGMGPRGLIKNIPNPRERWKAPVKVWIRNLYEDKFGRRAPAPKPQAVRPAPPPPGPPEGFFEAEFYQSSADYGPPTREDIAEQNDLMQRRQQNFRLAADYVADELAKFEPVTKIVLMGSVASPLKQEVPRFPKFRRAGQPVWQECKDVDLAVWLTDLTILNSLRKARSKALALLLEEQGVGVAHHQVEIFLFSPETNTHLGRLCTFNECPKAKPECRVKNCGAEKFLRQVERFVFSRDALAPDKTITLFERGVTDNEDASIPF